LPALLPWQDEMQFMRRTRRYDAWKTHPKQSGKALKNLKLISSRKQVWKISSTAPKNAAR
jgi:hypothetical protein